MFLLVQQGFAQTKLAGGFDHVIDVGRIPYYGKGYLTVLDLHLIFSSGGDFENYLVTFEYTDVNAINFGNNIQAGDLILEVNGESAKGWSKDDFYRAVDDKDAISLKIRGRRYRNGTIVIVEHETEIRPLHELHDNWKVFGNQFASIKGTLNSQRKTEFNRTKTSFEERIDEDFDFFPCTSFDYLITSNDPLLDKEILKQCNLFWLNRNEEKPDLLLTIAKNADESIATTYVPPTSRTVNTGSTTRAQYNYVTGKYDYITTQKNKTIREGGYVNETKTADIYLEISALDVKRLNDPKTISPPIVWQAIFKRHVTNYNFNVNDELKILSSWAAIPIDNKGVSVMDRIIYAPLGIVCSEGSPDVIQNIVNGSKADKLGLKPGDKLIKGKWTTMWAGRKKTHKTSLWNGMPDDKTVTIKVQRNSDKLTFELNPISIKVSRFYYSDKD